MSFFVGQENHDATPTKLGASITKNRTPLQDVNNVPSIRATEKWATTVSFSPQQAEPARDDEPITDQMLTVELKPFAPKEMMDFGEVISGRKPSLFRSEPSTVAEPFGRVSFFFLSRPHAYA